ncbi:MAG: helix-turn-helix domain-containing protein [Spiroplasma sp.]|nr:helix-turn-helix domain-containing protein [Spiroplasma sp.]
MIKVNKNKEITEINEQEAEERKALLDAFGKRMKTLRHSKGKKFSQEKLSEISGLHRNYISDVERGTRNVSLVAMLKIIESLDISMADFFAEGFDNENK